VTSFLVAGGLNVDTLARIDGTPVTGTSNPGRTVRSAGGVARNIAENLSRLDDVVALVGAIGDDEAGAFLLDSVAAGSAAPVDTTRVRRLDRTGSYTAVLDGDGELVVGVADMDATEQVGAEDIDPSGFDWLVLDGNLLPATVGPVLARATCPVALDPVGVAKAARLGTLEAFPVHTFTPTREELAAFTGTDDVDEGTAVAHARGVRWVWLREGARGSQLLGSSGERHHVAPVAGPVVDVTGAGDAMLAGYLHALGTGAGPAEAAAYGAAAATLTIASPSTVRPDLDDALVRRTLAGWRP
jgi:pseudouridine kinase